MTVSVLQERALDNGATVTASLALAFSSNVTAASSLHGAGTWGSTTGTGTFSDNNSGSWSTVASAVDAGDGQSSSTGVADHVNSGACTVTFTPPSSTTAFVGIAIREIGGTSGYDSSTGTAVETSAPGTTANAIKGTAKTPGSIPGLVSCFVQDATGGTTGLAQGTGYSLGLANTNWPGIGSIITESLRYTAVSSQQATATDATHGGSHHYMVMTAFFKESITLTGQAATSHAGSMGVSHAEALTGARITSAQGSVATSHAQALTGQATTSHAGSMGDTRSLLLAGQQLVSAGGTITANIAGNVTVSLTGIAMRIAAGTIGALLPSLFKPDPLPIPRRRREQPRDWQSLSKSEIEKLKRIEQKLRAQREGRTESEPAKNKPETSKPAALKVPPADTGAMRKALTRQSDEAADEDEDSLILEWVESDRRAGLAEIMRLLRTLH